MLEGHLLNERYRIKRTIGGGGMANVYLADDTILKREVAIKVLRLEFADDEEFIERFDREAQAATSLAHPNIVNIYDVGEEKHILYMVMEYVDGVTLKEYVQRQGPLEVEEALNIMTQVTSAISHAHANDLIHRDIKPQNILIDKFGNVKVTDFGIAIALSATSLTQTNSILGSVHYLSPEQARGGMATKKSDIYSLGIVLFELLAGRLPFSGQSPISIALKHLQNDTPSVKRFNENIPQSVENIILKATTKNPFHRYPNVYAMQEALETALYPEKMNESKYVPPIEEGEETKAIPIITDEHLNIDNNGDTIVHKMNEETQVVEEPKEQEEKPKKKRKKKRKWKAWLFGSLAFLALTAGLLIYIAFLPDDVQVPDVIGLDYEEAVELLKEVDLKAEREFVISDEVEEGFVVRTDPSPERTVKENSVVKVFVSEGGEKVSFDDYVGKVYSQVKRVLEPQYKEVIAYEKASDKPVGEIITQIQPEAGSEVVPMKTTVIFEVSSGPDKVKLNNFKGLTEKEVTDYARTYGFKVSVQTEYSDTVKKGEVIRQHPEANSDVNIGDTINIVVSLGPEKLPPRAHPVTFTVPFKPKDDETEQKVYIYVDDAENDMSDLYREETITEDKEFTINLMIEEGKRAEYKVMRDDDVILSKKVSYKEGG